MKTKGKPEPVAVSKTELSDGSVYVTVTYQKYDGEFYDMKFSMKSSMHADNYIETHVLPYIRKKS